MFITDFRVFERGREMVGGAGDRSLTESEEPFVLPDTSARTAGFEIAGKYHFTLASSAANDLLRIYYFFSSLSNTLNY